MRTVATPGAQFGEKAVRKWPKNSARKKSKIINKLCTKPHGQSYLEIATYILSIGTPQLHPFSKLPHQPEDRCSKRNSVV